jgi:tetratricopeptide (TPR) repeat protein
MTIIALEASPIAKLLIELAEQSADGYLELEGRRVVISGGDIVDVSPSEGDESLEQFLVDSAMANADALDRARADADREDTDIETVLVRNGLMEERDLKSARRSLFLDRLVRSLRELRRTGGGLPRLRQGDPDSSRTGIVRLVPLLLDALARCATDEDAEAVGARLNYRLTWLQGQSTESAKKWAALGSLPEQPTVSTILLRTPAAAPTIAALERAGLIELTGPGSVTPDLETARVTVPQLSPSTSTLSPPSIPSFPDLPLDDRAASSTDQRPKRGSGSDGAGFKTIPWTDLRDFALNGAPFDDPVTASENAVFALDRDSAPARDRAQALCELGRTWETSLDAIEEAARAYGNAAAVDPYLEQAPRQAARLCLALGDTDSSLAYARVASVTATAGKERALALRRLASIARLKGDMDGCLEAMCEAAAEDENDARPHEQVAKILAGQGNPKGAVAHLRLAISSLRAEQPERARSLCALARSLVPADTDLISEHVRLLEETGRGVAASSVLGDVARREHSRETRRELRLRAALLAEEHGRPDRAADLLLEAFDEEPHVDLFHDPLFENLKASGTPEEVAIVAEEIAGTCPDERKALWYRRAGEAAFGIRDAHEKAVLLLATAVEFDPSCPEALAALEALEKHAVSRNDHIILVDALHKAAASRSITDPKAATVLLERAALVAEECLGSVFRALDAWNGIAENSPDNARAKENVERLTEKARIRQGLMERIERELEEAGAADRPEVLARLALLLLDRTRDRARAIETYQEIVTARPDDESNFSLLVYLLNNPYQGQVLIDLLEAAVASTPDGDRKKRLLAAMASARSRQMDHRAAAEACRSLLALAPQNTETVVRLDRTATKLKDVQILVEARSQRIRRARTALERGMALVRLARVLESSSRFDEAVSAADGALVADPTSAEAALLLLRHLHRLPSERAVVILDLVRSALGDSPPILSLAEKAARVARDRHAYLRALESWSRVSPLDCKPLQGLLDLITEEGREPSEIAAAARLLLDPDIVDRSVSRSMKKAVERLSVLGAHDEAFVLATEAQDALGEGDFAALAIREALTAGNPGFEAVALERTLPFRTGEERREALRRLSELYLARGEKAGELHARLRLVATDPRDLGALDRLATLYADNGNPDKLLSVLSLAVEAEDEPDGKRQRMLDLASAYARAASDMTHAEECIRAIIFDFPYDERWVLKALGAFFSLGGREWGINRILSLAHEAPSEIGASMFLWGAATVESEWEDVAGALNIAVRGLDSFHQHAGLLLLMEGCARKTGDIETAVNVYDRLAEHALGKHGRRALYYRAGRWLEEMGRAEMALAYYGKAFDIAPSRGVLFSAIERLALQLDAPAFLIGAHEALAEVAGSEAKRAALLHSAGALYLEQTDNTDKAVELLTEAWKTVQSAEIESSLRQAAFHLRGTDNEAAEAILTMLNDRSLESQSAISQHEALLDDTAASTTSIDPEMQTAATRTVDQEVEEGTEDGSPESPPAPLAADASASAEPSGATPVENRSSPPGSTDTVGWQTSTETATPIDGDAASQAEAAHLLRTLVCREPSNTEAIRKLHRLLLRIGARVEADTVSEILSTFDDSVEPSAGPVFYPGICSPSEIEAGGEPAGEAGRRRLLELVWEAVRTMPRFTTVLKRHGVEERDRIAATSTAPVAAAYARAAAMLNADIPLFLKKNGDGALLVAATNPPALIASSDLQESGMDMVFTFGRAIWLARPENVLAATLSAEQMELLLRAVWAAFAPPSRCGETSQEAKKVASELWQAMPVRSQREVHDLVQEYESLGDRKLIYERVHEAAARAGLLTSGSVRAALLSLASLDPSLKSIALGDEPAFQQACRASSEFAAIVRFAFSSVYLAIRALA